MFGKGIGMTSRNGVINININGEIYEFKGQNVTLSGNDIIIDGMKVDLEHKEEIKNAPKLNISILGDTIANIIVSSALNVYGNIEGKIDSTSSVSVEGNVDGNIETCGNVTVGGSVGKSIDTSGNVYVSGDVHGKINASGNVMVDGKRL